LAADFRSGPRTTAHRQIDSNIEPSISRPCRETGSDRHSALSTFEGTPPAAGLTKGRSPSRTSIIASAPRAAHP
jgi:hypothetical protein